MSQINPFAASILQSSTVQRHAATERDKQMRRAADAAKNADPVGDRVEFTVESSDHPEETGDDQKQRRQQQKRQNRKPDDQDDEQTHLDVKA